MTSGSVVGVVVDGGLVSPVFLGGSRRPPVLPPSRPSSSVPEAGRLAGAVAPRAVGRAVVAAAGCRGAAGTGGGVGGRRPGVLSLTGPAAALGGRLREEGLQRGDLFVYGVEDRRDLLTDVPELDGQPVAQGAPDVAVRAGEGVQGLDGAQGVRVALVRRGQQAVALGGVVPHAGQGAADLAQRLVVELAAAVALHEPHGPR